MASKINIVITVFKTCRRKISILNTKYYESPFENCRVRINKVSKTFSLSFSHIVIRLIRFRMSSECFQCFPIGFVHGNGLSGCHAIGAPLTVACFERLGALTRDSDKPTVRVKFLATRSGDRTSTTCTLFVAENEP